MSKPILTLPCKYTINDFEQKAGGHYCQSCDHVLKDFRNSTDEEMNAAIKASGNKTCGIFYSNQVQPKTTVYQLGLQRRIGLSLLGILGFISPVVLTSCEEKKTGEEPQADQLSIEEIAFSKLKFPMTVSGYLMARGTEEPLSMSTISVFQNGNTLRTIETDDRGFFSFMLEKDDVTSTHFELLVEHLGYKPDTIHEVGNMSKYDQSHLKLELEAYPEPVDESGFTAATVPWVTYGSMVSMPPPYFIPDDTWQLSNYLEENCKK